MIGKYRDDLTNGRLTEKQIQKAISWKRMQNSDIDTLSSYYFGNNPSILHSSDTVNRIPAPYGRKLLKIVTGFMFKEGCITYKFPDDKKELEEYIEEIFDCNDEETKNARLAKDQAAFGSAFEAVYVDNNEAHIKFNRMDPRSVVPVYSHAVDDEIVAAINFYTKADDKKEYAEVYYSDVIQKFSGVRGHLSLDKTIPHPFGMVPIIEYRNNEEGLSDIDPIKKLIDAHDRILSNALDEDDKFADAILVMKNFSLDEEAVAKLREAKVIDDVDEDAEISYLTKPETYAGREVLRSTVEKLIHSLSGIPKLDDQGALQAESGEAMKYLYATFEMVVAGEKQSEFNNGLQRRLRLLSNFASWLGLAKCGSNGIRINWSRNLPAEQTTIIDNTVKVADRISQKSFLEKMVEADVIDDVDEELKRMEEEASSIIGAEDDKDAYDLS